MNNLEQKILEGLLRESYEIHIRNAGVYRFPASYEFREHSHRETIFRSAGGFIISW